MYILILGPLIKYISTRLDPFNLVYPLYAWIVSKAKVRIQLLVYGLFSKTAVTYSPTFTQYHRHDRA